MPDAGAAGDFDPAVWDAPPAAFAAAALRAITVAGLTLPPGLGAEAGGGGEEEPFAAPVAGVAVPGAPFADETFAGAAFAGAGFAGAGFAGAAFAGAAFAGAAFAERAFEAAAFADEAFADEAFAGAGFEAAAFAGAVFAGADLAGGAFAASLFDPAPFIDLLLEGVDFAEAREAVTPELFPPAGADFAAADFAVLFAAGVAEAGDDSRPFAGPEAADEAAALFLAEAGDDVPFAGVGAGAFFAGEEGLFRPGPFDPEAGEFDLLFAAMISCRR